MNAPLRPAEQELLRVFNSCPLAGVQLLGLATKLASSPKVTDALAALMRVDDAPIKTSKEAAR